MNLKHFQKHERFSNYMKLFFAEKPSLGRAVVEALPKPHQKKDGYIIVGNGDVVTWCIGHLLEQAEPDSYNSIYKKWSVDHLHIIPVDWKLVVKPKTKKQFSVVKKLIKDADTLINVGDPDREGQILIDEMINYCGASALKKANAQRCLISDLNVVAVKKSLNNLKLNKDFLPLSVSALARARADWLYGMNMTRMCTLQGQRGGYKGVLSIGRVQTPILGLVVHRDLEIKKFVPKSFYEVHAVIETKEGSSFTGKWKPSEACEPYMDEEGRVLSKSLAENVVNRITNKTGKILSLIKKTTKKSVPLPHALSSLQIEAAKVFGFSAQNVLDICQALYERHKLITYPRSDCRYLPTGHLAESSKVIQAILNVSPKLSQSQKEVDITIKSLAWNDKKVEAHHAIIPTMKVIEPSRLSQDERNVYYLIARHYMAQFYPPSQYADKEIKTQIEGGLFISKQRDLTFIGWEVLFNKNVNEKKQSSDNLPDVSKGEVVLCLKGMISDKNTTPPKRFTDASLLTAMTGISRYVSSPEIKKVLKETDGIGTEATRAGIIELLFKRQYLIRKGKDIISTEVGQSVITSLPDDVGKPDMTAIWESQLESIYRKEQNYSQFMKRIISNLEVLLSEAKHADFSNLSGMGQAKFTKYKKRKRVK